MTRGFQFGPPLSKTDAVGDRKVRSNPTPRQTAPPIQWRKFCVNGYAASAQFADQLHEATNHAALHRTRQLFWAPGYSQGMIANWTSTASSRPRFRFAFRTSSCHHALMAFVTMQPPDATTAGAAAYARLKIYSDAAESTLVSTTDFYYGPNPGGTTDSFIGYKYSKTVALQVSGLSADTEYYAVLSDESGARIHTATVIELQSVTQAFSGYLPMTLNHDSEVLSVYRQRVAEIQKKLWKSAGGTILTWTVADQSDPAEISNGSAVNLVDGTSTTISASTPGFTFDMRYKKRRSQTTIPCVMKAYGKYLDGIASHLYLKNSDGATIADIDTFGHTYGWHEVTFDMPATLDTYYLMAARQAIFGDEHIDIGAVSIYPYES